MRFVELATVSERVAATAKRGEKTALLGGVLRSMTADEAAIAVGLLIGQPRQGRTGVGWSTLSKLDVGDADEPTLEILEIDRWLSDLAAESGPGSATSTGRAVGFCVVSGDGGRATTAVGCVQRRIASGCTRRCDG